MQVAVDVGQELLRGWSPLNGEGLGRGIEGLRTEGRVCSNQPGSREGGRKGMRSGRTTARPQGMENVK